MLETPALEIVLALVAFQLAAFLYLYRRRRNEEHAASTTTASTATASDRTDPPEERSVIECISCGAENDPDYRYCRRCISDLAGEPGPGRRGRSPSGRLF